jgi:hypothetical protein
MWDVAHQLWQSSAHFYADRQGVVDLARQASEGGSYLGLDDMGLFWSVRPAYDPKPEATQVYATTTAPWVVRLSALVAASRCELAISPAVCAANSVRRGQRAMASRVRSILP